MIIVLEHLSYKDRPRGEEKAPRSPRYSLQLLDRNINRRTNCLHGLIATVKRNSFKLKVGRPTLFVRSKFLTPRVARRRYGLPIDSGRPTPGDRKARTSRQPAAPTWSSPAPPRSSRSRARRRCAHCGSRSTAARPAAAGTHTHTRGGHRITPGRVRPQREAAPPRT